MQTHFFFKSSNQKEIKKKTASHYELIYLIKQIKIITYTAW